MSKLNQQLEQLHKPVDKTLLRVLSLILGFVNVGLFMWNPDQYADAIGGFSPVLGLLFCIVCVCQHGIWSRIPTEILALASGVQSVLVTNCVELPNVNVRYLNKTRALLGFFTF